MLEKFSETLSESSDYSIENKVEVFTLSSDFDQSEPETLTSSDWEPHISRINLENERKIQLIDTLKEKSSEEECSEEIDQLDLKMKNIPINNVSHKDFNYTFTENEFSKNLDLETGCSEIKTDQKINIDDHNYFKEKFPQYERELSVLLEKFFTVKLNKSSYNFKNQFFKKLSPNIIKTHETNWMVVNPKNELIEIGTKVPYISIFFWLNLILESDLKKKIIKKKPINSNTSVYEKNFKPSSIFDVESIKKKNIIFQEDETPFILSIYIDDQAYDSSRKKSVKAVYLVVENFETGSRLKDKTIFLLMNLPKNVPIYNLTGPLPFVKELFQLSKMKNLYKHKINVVFHQIIGDSVEQQKAAGKLSSSGTEMCRSCSLNKKDIFFNLGKKLYVHESRSNLNISNSNFHSNSNKEEFTLNSNSKNNKTKSNSNTETVSNSNSLLNFIPKSDPKYFDSNFFDVEIKAPFRDPIKIKTTQKEYILNFFRSNDFQKTTTEHKKIKTSTGVIHQNCNFWLHFFGFDSCDFSRFSICWAHLLLEGLFKDGLQSIKQRLNKKIDKISKKLNYLNSYLKFISIPLNPLNKPNDLTAIECLELSMVLGLCIDNSKENLIIFEWLDLFNSIVSNLYLPSRSEKNELELEVFCNRFRIKHIELIDYFMLKPHLFDKDHNENIKKINEIRKKRIKTISLKNYIAKKDLEIKELNKSKREKQKFKRYRRVNKKLFIYKKKIDLNIENKIKKLSIHKKKLKIDIESMKNSILQKNTNKLNNILKHPNLHYLRHLPQCVRENGSLFTFFLALERYHQHFKIKKYQIKKRGFPLLKFFIEREIFRKINENSKKNFNLEKKNKYNYKISKELCSIFSFLNFDFSELTGLKEITFNSHLFRVGNFVYTFNNEWVFIREILQNRSNDKFLLVQKIKYHTVEEFYYFENPREFYLISPDEFRNITNFIPGTWFDAFCKEVDQKRLLNSKSNEEMKIEKEVDSAIINQPSNNLDNNNPIEIEIEPKETNNSIPKIQIIKVKNQVNPQDFKITLNLNKKSSEYL
ncbi:hypothetical protein M0813_15538 [Anaeramoeba flamelloides]|uniref:Uncharacterized protein n=1 Tax=Anaeramoeba flamelloides TaxID=1746091 RepID=A0ABQ8Z1N3_9EUKA|nr:hypothetical protein M0813_15538 [Anaeramoeba flamelloides]